jgi:esterase/lipase superfamily enzyme
MIDPLGGRTMKNPACRWRWVLLITILLEACSTGRTPSRETSGATPVALPEPTHAVVTVYFATDRNLVSKDTTHADFGGQRSEVSYGTIEVSIPHDHRMGELERPWEMVWVEEEDPGKHIMLLKTVVEDKNAFFADIRQRIAESTKKQAFIFVHGYNVEFSEAARRTAQISYDLKFRGAPTFYSWPSVAAWWRYPADESNIEWSQANFRRFLEDFLMRTDADRVYLIAHSMDNHALTFAVTSLLRERPEFGSRIKEIILAAPDIDAAVFKRDIAPAMTTAHTPITLYASSWDWALLMSHRWHGYQRAGDSYPEIPILSGIETVDATDVDTSLVGHSYFADERSVLSDVFYVVNEDYRADRRFGLRKVESSDGPYWVFQK